MNNIKKLIEENNLYSNNYSFVGKTRILDTNKGKYVVKKKNKDKRNLYNYLLSRNFDNFLDTDFENDNYEIFPYVEQVQIPEEQKAIDLVYLMSMLHNQTTFYKEIELDEIKKRYEEIIGKIEYLNNYYHNIQDNIERKVYFSPDEYLLIRNISLVYETLNYSYSVVNKWYDSVKNKTSERWALVHNNMDTSHFLEGEKKIVISWDKATEGNVLGDFVYFYKKEYSKLDMNKLFDIYQSKYSYTDQEKLLFFTLITIPEKIVLDNHKFNSCIKVYDFIDYISKTRQFILKQNEKYPKTNE